MNQDDELMARVAEGDMDAFEELVRRHQRAALNVAYRFVNDGNMAEDIAQEAFLRILAGAARYRPSGGFRTFLYNIVWHLCIDLYRKKSALPLEPRIESRTAGPGETALRNERSNLVRAAIGKLPPRQRMALVLKHYEGLSYQEIARSLGCSPRAVDSLLVRAKAKLKDTLEGLL